MRAFGGRWRGPPGRRPSNPSRQCRQQLRTHQGNLGTGGAPVAGD